MRVLKTVYIILCVSAFILFNILYLHHHLFFGFLNVFLLLLSPLGYIYSNLLTYLLAAFSWLIVFPLNLFIYKMDPVNSILPVFIFNCLLSGFLVYKDMINKEKTARDKELKKEEDKAGVMGLELEKFSLIETEIREKELAIVNLYVVTQKMSGSLTFGDIFKVFSSFLKENFRFKRCCFLIPDWEGPEGVRIGSAYGVLREGEKGKPAEGINYDKLVKLLADNPEELSISRDDSREAFVKLDIKDTDVTELTAIPLLNEKKLAAVLAIENLPRSDIEKFRILSMQFALEMKKILLYETVEKLAITDSLTGLYARRYFFERLNEEAQRSKRYKFKFAFLMSDIDDFKKVNDTYGHLVGDAILKDIGRMVKENVREIDLVSRYGGEEFALMLPETGLDGGKLVAERIRKKIEEAVFKAYDEKVRVTISIGISIYPKDADKIKDLVEKADRALYAAKKSGKNVVCEYGK